MHGLPPSKSRRSMNGARLPNPCSLPCPYFLNIKQRQSGRTILLLPAAQGEKENGRSPATSSWPSEESEASAESSADLESAPPRSPRSLYLTPPPNPLRKSANRSSSSRWAYLSNQTMNPSNLPRDRWRSDTSSPAIDPEPKRIRSAVSGSIRVNWMKTQKPVFPRVQIGPDTDLYEGFLEQKTSAFSRQHR